MIERALIDRLFDGFAIQRWNDQLRPVSFVEIDKTAHKMAIAYCLARFEEDVNKATVQWHDLVRCGIFEYLRRSVLSDIKSPVYRRIKTRYPDTFKNLSSWVYSQLESQVPAFLREELKTYLTDEAAFDPLALRILRAAHVYATYWEFQIIRACNPTGFQIEKINGQMHNDLGEHLGLAGVQQLVARRPIEAFVSLIGTFDSKSGGARRRAFRKPPSSAIP